MTTFPDIRKALRADEECNQVFARAGGGGVFQSGI